MGGRGAARYVDNISGLNSDVDLNDEGSDVEPAATAYKDGYYASGNLLFNPFGSLNVGVEYLYGSHEQKDGGKGTANRVQFAAKYDLYRKRPVEQK